MSLFQRTVVVAALVAGLGAAVYEARRASALEDELHSVQRAEAARAPQVQAPPNGSEVRLAAETKTNASVAVDPELLRLRGEVGVLRRQLAAAEARATNQITFSHPFLPREAWTDQGTDKPMNAVLTMFWALRQGDQAKLEQIVSPMKPSQTAEDLTFRRAEWERLSAVQVVRVVTVSKGETPLNGDVQVIVERAPIEPGEIPDIDVLRFMLTPTNGQWVVRSAN